MKLTKRFASVKLPTGDMLYCVQIFGYNVFICRQRKIEIKPQPQPQVTSNPLNPNASGSGV